MRFLLTKPSATCGIVAASLAAVLTHEGPEITSRVTPQLPTTFTNLQVLPKDIRQRPLIDMMRNFALSLDVRCQFCHVGEGDDLSKFDFASDAKPTKATARKMLRMVTAINAQVGSIGEPAPAGSNNSNKVTCFSCHRGARKPLTAPGGGGS